MMESILPSSTQLANNLPTQTTFLWYNMATKVTSLQQYTHIFGGNGTPEKKKKKHDQQLHTHSQQLPFKLISPLLKVTTTTSLISMEPPSSDDGGLSLWKGERGERRDPSISRAVAQVHDSLLQTPQPGACLDINFGTRKITPLNLSADSPSLYSIAQGENPKGLRSVFSRKSMTACFGNNISDSLSASVQ